MISPVFELKKCKSPHSSKLGTEIDTQTWNLCILALCSIPSSMWVFNWLEEVAERGRKSHIFTYQIYLTMSNYILLDSQQKKCLGNLFQKHNYNLKKKERKKKKTAILDFFCLYPVCCDSGVSLLGTSSCFHFFFNCSFVLQYFIFCLLLFALPTQRFPRQMAFIRTIPWQIKF